MSGFVEGFAPFLKWVDEMEPPRSTPLEQYVQIGKILREDPLFNAPDITDEQIASCVTFAIHKILLEGSHV